MSLQVTDKTAASVSLGIPLSFGEIAVITRLIEFCLPRFLAFDLIFANPSDDRPTEDEDEAYPLFRET